MSKQICKMVSVGQDYRNARKRDSSVANALDSRNKFGG